MNNGKYIGHLWARYLKVREELRTANEGPSDDITRRRSLERRGGHLRDRLLTNYSPLVKYVASRIGARMTEKSARYEDMVSWGILGLLDAIETYDPDYPGTKAKFETYAISKIRWAILDQLRSQDWVPRRLRVRAQEVEKARTGLAHKLRRAPTEEEIAAEAGMELTEYRSFLEQHSQAQVASLNAHLEGGEGPGAEYGTLIGDPSLVVDPQSQTNLEELRAKLVDAINKLEERERIVTSFYFYEGLTLKEIGKALELTEGRISQILKRALTKLREHLNGLLLDYGS
jgi:RNA polymerase sigma factor FliA